MTTGKKFRDHGGLTLIEVVIVVAIVAVLAAIAIPVLLRSKGAAKGTSDVSNLRQLGVAAGLYHDQNDDYARSTAQLVASHLVPTSICVSLKDNTFDGLANVLVKDRVSTPFFDKSNLTSYKNSYPGLREWVITPPVFDRVIHPGSSGGWLVDLSISVRKSPTDPVISWTGQYRRLLLDGAVIIRPHTTVELQDEKGVLRGAKSPVLLFTDDVEEFKKWTASLG